MGMLTRLYASELNAYLPHLYQILSIQTCNQ